MATLFHCLFGLNISILKLRQHLRQIYFDEASFYPFVFPKIQIFERLIALSVD